MDNYSFSKNLFLFLNLKIYCWTQNLEVFAGRVSLYIATICWTTQSPRTYWVMLVLSLAHDILAIGHARPCVFSQLVTHAWSVLWWIMLALGFSHTQSLLQWVTLWLLVPPIIGHTHAQLLSFFSHIHPLTTREENSLLHLESDNLNVKKLCDYWLLMKSHNVSRDKY